MRARYHVPQEIIRNPSGRTSEDKYALGHRYVSHEPSETEGLYGLTKDCGTTRNIPATMSTEKVNECYEMLATIHAQENWVVLWYSQRGDERVGALHEALRKRKEYLAKLSEGIPVNMRCETLFTTP